MSFYGKPLPLIPASSGITPMASHHIYGKKWRHEYPGGLRCVHHHPDRAYYFFSTSKITFPGAGLALIASNSSNVAEIRQRVSAQIAEVATEDQRRAAAWQNFQIAGEHSVPIWTAAGHRS
ncbi:MAG: hypothetical protein ACLTLQ_14565 [[Clostridium] scindens]